MGVRSSVRSATAAAAAALCVAAALTAPGVAASAAPAPAGRVASELVFLRPSGAAPGSRGARAVALAAQAEVAGTLSRLGGTVRAATTVPDALVASLSSTAARALAADPLVRAVLPDGEIPGPASPTVATAPDVGRRGTLVHAACGTAAHPELDPEALTSIDDANADARGFDGKGVTVALLADGLQVANPDFRRNARYASAASPAGSHVITRYVDFSGDGTAARTGGGEAFLDASSIGAQGNEVYDLAQVVSRAHPLRRGCDVRIVGSAPGASIEALKVFGVHNEATSSGFLQAINYAVTHGVTVLNESFGGNGFPDTSADVVRLADEAAVAAGVTVVVSSGDGGPTATPASPSTDPDVLAVGASTTFRAYQQDSFGGINLPGERGTYVSGNVSALSSSGVAQDGKTVDLLAPGDLNWALCTPSPLYSDCMHQHLQLTGGTSESAPLTAGAAADVIEAYRSAHDGASPTPALVMRILTSTARDLGAPADQQGAGLLDVGAAVRLALSIAPSTVHPRPGGVLSSVTQADLQGAPSATVSEPITLTNTGATPVEVTATTRALVPVVVHHGAVTLDPGPASRQPRFAIWSGYQEVYQRQTLRVGGDMARIQLQAAYQYEGQVSPVHVALFTPSGALAGYSNPQGIGDYADVEVAHPEPGRWTAAFFTVWEGAANEVGSQGRVPWSFTELRDAPLGSVAPPTVDLGPGASSTVLYRDVLPSTPGDAAASIVLRETSGRATTVTSVPVTLRTLISVSGTGGHFRGVLTGGNGRADVPGQVNTFAFEVPPDEHDLDVGLSMAFNGGGDVLPADQLIGLLVDPNGVVQAYDTNFTYTDQSEVFTRYLSLYASDPVPGEWELLLEWAQPATGLRTAVPFAGSVEYDQVDVASALPDSAATDVGPSPESYTITVKNTGVAPMIVSPDARLTTTTQLTLPDLQGVASTQPLHNASNFYYVPPETSSITVAETSTVPATFDASFLPGDPDLSPLVAAPFEVAHWTSSSASLTYAPPDGVTPGLWGVVQAEVGPFPARGEPRGTETTVATVTTRAFDPAVGSTVGDSVEALATGQPLSPAYVAAGHTDSFQVSITPTASAGTVVTGTLFLDGLTLGSSVGGTIADTALFTSVLDAIPYEYTVGT